MAGLSYTYISGLRILKGLFPFNGHEDGNLGGGGGC